MSEATIVPYGPDRRAEVIELALKVWGPIFAKTKSEVPEFVYRSFYPDGWRVRQEADVGALLDANPEDFWLAVLEDELVGFVGLALHPEDRMGEIVIVAVTPEVRRQGVGRRLMAFAEARIRDAGMDMVMVETVGDSGHAPARNTYEALGYRTWPVARYFKPL